MSNKYWALVPAAGVGQRMGLELPKQYLKLHDKTIIEYSLEILAKHPLIDRVIVALHEDDLYWEQLSLPYKDKIMTVTGGETRANSVLNALNEISVEAHDNDWVLVHDAVRPCLHRSDLDH